MGERRDVRSLFLDLLSLTLKYIVHRGRKAQMRMMSECLNLDVSMKILFKQ